MPPPGACVTNDECPAGFICTSGVCKPDTKGQPGCVDNANCPSGQVCINGDCKPKNVCNIPHAQDRMGGTWRLDSKLHVRDGLKGFTKGLLGAATTLQNIIDGKFSIKGVPSFLSSIIGSILKNMIQQYVPPWGKEVISLLAIIDDVIDDTRVISLEHIKPLGNDSYTGHSEWEGVEFEFKGVKVSSPPQNIPGLGKVTTGSYTAREVCGVFFFDKHKVKNGIGQVYRWAVEAIITGVSCLNKNTPCYGSINAMFNDVINCPMLASSVAGQNGYPGLEALVLAACSSQKSSFINLLVNELNSLSVNMTYMSLKGKADIQNQHTMVNGKWYGVLGGALGKGNFEGSFSGVKL
jgi:Cys-rich repeat protein